MGRSMLLSVAAVITCILCFASPANAQGVIMPGEENIRLRCDLWNSALDASVKITSGTLIGTNVNAGDTLGMDMSQQTYVPMVVSFGRFGFHLEFWRNTYLGDKVLEEDVVFDAKVFPAGDQMQSKMVLDNVDLRFWLDFMKPEKVDLGPLIGIRYQRFQVWLDDLGPGTVDSVDKIQHVPMPYVGAGLKLKLTKNVIVGGELGWMNVTMSEYDYKLQDYIDFSAFVEVRLIEMFAICGGYRYLDYRLLAKKEDAEYTLEESIQGMSLGVTLVF